MTFYGVLLLHFTMRTFNDDVFIPFNMPFYFYDGDVLLPFNLRTFSKIDLAAVEK